jgi:lactoylglutathione lyase
LGTFVGLRIKLILTLTYDASGVSVDDLHAACKRFEDLKVSWKKRLTDGRMKTVAFILDPDNYWIEVVQNDNLKHKSEI